MSQQTLAAESNVSRQEILEVARLARLGVDEDTASSYADDISDEQTVEQPAFKDLRQFSPVFEGLVLGRVVSWMSPQTVIDVPDAVHVESIEQDLFFAHQMVPRSGGFSSLR